MCLCASVRACARACAGLVEGEEAAGAGPVDAVEAEGVAAQRRRRLPPPGEGAWVPTWVRRYGAEKLGRKAAAAAFLEALGLPGEPGGGSVGPFKSNPSGPAGPRGPQPAWPHPSRCQLVSKSLPAFYPSRYQLSIGVIVSFYPFHAIYYPSPCQLLSESLSVSIRFTASFYRRYVKLLFASLPVIIRVT